MKVASGASGKVGEIRVGLQSANLGLGRMHWPDRSLKTHLPALLDDVQRPARPKDGNVARAEKAVEAAHAQASSAG
jgi:hypothetical protein